LSAGRRALIQAAVIALRQAIAILRHAGEPEESFAEVGRKMGMLVLELREPPRGA